MKHAFLSYVSENYPAASRIAAVLEANGITAWLDRNQLRPGQGWLDEIRKAIRDGSFFLPLFSTEWAARERSVANEELLIAIEELRRRPYAQAWLLPVKIDACEIPDVPIGPGRSLRDLHWADFASGTQAEVFRSILSTMGVEAPDLSMLAADERGWPAQLRILRRDKWVGRIPLRYFLDGEVIADTSDGDFTLSLPPTGDKTLYCDTAWFERSPLQTRGGNMQGNHYRGLSKKIVPRLLSGHRYELFVSADSMLRRLVSSPYIELGRWIFQGLGGGGVDLDKPETWPRIQMRISRL